MNITRRAAERSILLGTIGVRIQCKHIVLILSVLSWPFFVSRSEQYSAGRQRGVSNARFADLNFCRCVGLPFHPKGVQLSHWNSSTRLREAQEETFLIPPQGSSNNTAKRGASRWESSSIYIIAHRDTPSLIIVSGRSETDYNELVNVNNILRFTLQIIVWTGNS